MKQITVETLDYEFPIDSKSETEIVPQINRNKFSEANKALESVWADSERLEAKVLAEEQEKFRRQEQKRLELEAKYKFD